MMRGIATFKCPKCGKVFNAPDTEYRATVFTTPMPCPCCGTLSPKDDLVNQLAFKSMKLAFKSMKLH